MLLASCAQDRDPGVPETPPSTARDARPAPPDPDPAAPSPGTDGPVPAPADRNVVITSPKEGAKIATNPIRIAGLARTFENNVEIRVDDQHGQPLLVSHATARGEMGSFNPWSSQILLTDDPGASITITAIERSARDGSIRTSHAVTLPVEARRMPVILYFTNANQSGTDCAAVEKVVRDVPASVSTARLALEALVRGPTHAEAVAGFRSLFPKGAALRSVNLRDGVLTADFNEAMQNVGGSCRVQAIRAAIEKTMTSIPGVKRVVITAMGDEDTALQP